MEEMTCRRSRSASPSRSPAQPRRSEGSDRYAHADLRITQCRACSVWQSPPSHHHFLYCLLSTSVVQVQGKIRAPIQITIKISLTPEKSDPLSFQVIAVARWQQQPLDKGSHLFVATVIFPPTNLLPRVELKTCCRVQVCLQVLHVS